uniref:Immunoglobulin V-set domain-containing protein n=1 Tax=Lates calcarifer TaxID=8187 RepID=A0A4W6E0J8_LATCA
MFPSFGFFLFHVVTVALICVASTAAVIHVSGYEGRDVNVSCSYGEGYESYEKYLCRNDCGDSDVLITTTEAKKNKYSIYDDKKRRVFTTTISDLSSVDAGKYWCGVTRTGKDIYTEVRLEVVPVIFVCSEKNTNLLTWCLILNLGSNIMVIFIVLDFTQGPIR